MELFKKIIGNGLRILTSESDFSPLRPKLQQRVTGSAVCIEEMLEPVCLLGTLLLQSGYITANQYRRGLRRSSTFHLPLGRILVLQGVLSESVLAATLELAHRVSDSKISLKVAISLLKVSYAQFLPPLKVDDYDSGKGQYPAFALSDLFCFSERLTRSDALLAKEFALTEGGTFEEALLKLELATEASLGVANKLMCMVDRHEFNPSAVVSCFRRMNEPAIDEVCAIKGLEVVQPIEDLCAVIDETLQSARSSMELRESIKAMQNELLSTFSDDRESIGRQVFKPLCTVYLKIANSLFRNKEYLSAEQIYRHVLVLKSKSMSANDPGLVDCLTDLAGTLCAQQKFSEAVPPLRQIITILENNRNYDGPKLALYLHMLAGIYLQLGMFGEAEPLLGRALTVRECYLPEDDPGLSDVLRDYAYLLEKTNRNIESEKMYVQARSVSK
jgi:tetratricopeptide (TPR) repeat protein